MFALAQKQTLASANRSRQPLGGRWSTLFAQFSFSTCPLRNSGARSMWSAHLEWSTAIDQNGLMTAQFTRRRCIATLGAAMTPGYASAEQAPTPVIGLLDSSAA